MRRPESLVLRWHAASMQALLTFGRLPAWAIGLQPTVPAVAALERWVPDEFWHPRFWPVD